jgi:hypothetical protein
MNFGTKLVASLLVACSAALTPAAGAQSYEVKTTEGAIWRGNVNDAVEVVWTQKGVEQTVVGTLTRVEKSYIVVRGEVAGKVGDVTVFRADIKRMSAADASKVKSGSTDAAKPGDAKPEGADKPVAGLKDGEKKVTSVSSVKGTDGDKKEYLKSEKPGAFLLPLEGQVGLEFRKEEIKAIGEEADKYGPGQIIVFRIKSGGGSVMEMDQISDILLDMRERHRIVAWIEEAISAACFTALHCNEIYFKTNGAAGSMTMWSGGPGGAVAKKGVELQAVLDRMGKIAEIGGRSPILARSMVHYPLICTYDKDPATGKVTFYDTMKGQYVLSDANDNLTLISSQAVHCGFADGIADTEEELAKKLGLPAWHEVTTYGRDIQKKWVETVERANVEIPALLDKYEIWMSSQARDNEVKLGNAIQTFKELINWHRRAPNAVMMMGLPPVENLERMIDDLQYELSRIKKMKRETGR